MKSTDFTNSKKKLGIFIGLIFIAVATFIGLGGYYLGVKYQKTIITNNSPEELISHLKTLCLNKDYKNVAYNSVKEKDGDYEFINVSEIATLNEASSYLNSALGLCSVITSSDNIEIKKTKISDSEWEYQYITPWGSNGFGIVLFKNSWRFVLHLGAYL